MKSAAMTYLEAFFLLLCSVAVFALGIRLFKKGILVGPFFIFAFALLSAAALAIISAITN